MTEAAFQDSARRPSVAVFLPSLRGGGAQRVAIQIANGLVERGVGVDLVLAEDHGPYRNEVGTGVRVVGLGCRRTSAALWPLLRYLRRERPAALFSGQPHGSVIAYLAARLSGWKGRLIVRETNSASAALGRRLTPVDRVVRRLSQAVYRRADAVIAPSRGVASELPGNVTVIPNPVDSAEIRRLASAPLPAECAGGAPFVLGVGRLSVQKRFGDLITAVAALEHYPALRLVLLGEGPEQAGLTNLARRLGISDRVHMPGFDPNPYRYMAHCAVFVLSSAWEGLPNALLQAMACGAPVVATDCPHGPREILKDGRFGELVPVGDIEALSAAIARQLESGRKPYAAEALASFDLDRIIDAYASVLLRRR